MVVFSLSQQLDNGRIDRDVFGEELGNFCIPSVYAKGILRSHIFFPYVRSYVRMFVRKFWEIVYNELLA